jgi:hypothetical protein
MATKSSGTHPTAPPSQSQLALGDAAARQLANATKTAPILPTISPRWLTHLLQWLPVEAGIYRLNKVSNPEAVQVLCAKRDEADLPTTFADYETAPREYFLNAVSTVLDVHTRVSDLYSSPHDQIKEQLRLTIETIKEKQESELINNADYGLLASVHPDQIVYPLTGAPTPDDLDELLTKVWKEPAFFLTHPLAIAAFGRECTRRGVPPPTVSLFGVPHLARHPADPVRQAAGGRRQDQDHPAARGREAPGRGRSLPAGAGRRAESGPERALHGHQPQRDCVLPDQPVLLAGSADG